MKLRPGRRRLPVAATLDAKQVGATLVVYPPGRIRDEVAEFAAWLPADPQRTVVVVDVPAPANPWTWSGLVEALRGIGPIRLAVADMGSGQCPPAGWLALQLSVEVVAPDGALVPLSNGAIYVQTIEAAEVGSTSTKTATGACSRADFRSQAGNGCCPMAS